MASPSGGAEPGQRPEFMKSTVVLKGKVHVELEEGVCDIVAGHTVATGAGEWGRYTTPDVVGAGYVAVCLPAFSPATVHRDE
jgi:hypothetical protein